VNNILSLMTAEEKIAALSTDPSVPRLGIVGSPHLEGLHGVALGGPGGWEGHQLQPLPTTQFPQVVGLGETWDPDLIRQVAAVEGYEARYIFNTDIQVTVNGRGEKHRRAGIVMRAPQIMPAPKVEAEMFNPSKPATIPLDKPNDAVFKLKIPMP